MEPEDKIEKLTEIFRALGASEPESWARSQVEEGIPQYGRFAFLRQAWRNVIPEKSTSWIDEQIEYSAKMPSEPGAAIGPALKRILSAGASRQDITEIVRIMQWRTLEGVMNQIDDSITVDYPNDVPQVYWGLFETDEELNPLHQLGALHESVLDTEPSGREMRPEL